MTTTRALAFGLVLFASTLLPAATGSASACAAEASGSDHAALVVGTGARTTTYCVELDATTVSGIDLIQLAGSQFGLQYSLGFGGQAVCQLDGVGASGSDCFGSYPDFWGYWHGSGSGGWSWAGSGAASASIQDGDIEGWVWGSGDSGTTHAAPPALAFDDVCDDVSSSPPPSPDDDGGGGTGDGGNGGGGSGNGDAGSGGGDGASGGGATPDASVPGSASGSEGPNDDDPQEPDEGSADVDPSAEEIVEATSITELAGGVTDEGGGGGGPPPGAIVAVVAIAGLGAAGWILRRRQIARGED